MEKKLRGHNAEAPSPSSCINPFASWSWRRDYARCMKVEPHGGSGGEEGIEEFREKMMLDIRTVKESIFREHVLDYKEHTMNEKDEWEQPKKERETTVEAKRWNFRKRRGDCEAPFMELGFVEEEKVNRSIRSTFISTLSKKEVEDDMMMMMMMGQPPPRRPEKRPRNVQKKINYKKAGN
ncbi:hypothetical protein Bca101_056125 [Brassica carinata]